MATEWKEPMAWDNAGTAPSDNLKTQGFKAGDKPPASVFNYFLNRTAESINQLQDEVDGTNSALDAHKTDTTTKLGNKVDKVSGMGLSTNDYTTTEKNKLAGIATGATKVTVDSSLSSSSTNPVQNKVINTALAGKSDTGHGHTEASTSASGFMSASDKTKLNGIATGANAYSHPTTSGNKHIPSGGSSGQILRWASDGTATWGADNDTTYVAATTSAAGLMSASDKTKLDGIATGANAYSLPAAGSSLGGVKSGGDVTISSGVITVNDDSHNHVISNVDGLQDALDGKSATSHTHNYAGSASAGGVANSAVSITPVTTAGTGAAYTATVEGISALTAGVSFIMVPNTVSTSTAPTLNVNSLGAKTIRRRLSNATTSTATGYAAAWLAASKPIRVEYDGTYWIADLPKPSAADISGTMAVANGGTGKSSVTANSFLVGNGTSAMVEKTAAEVRSLIGALNQAEIETLIELKLGVIENGTY